MIVSFCLFLNAAVFLLVNCCLFVSIILLELKFINRKILRMIHLRRHHVLVRESWFSSHTRSHHDIKSAWKRRLNMIRDQKHVNN